MDGWHPTGTVTIHLTDDARADPVLGPAARRRLAVQLVYPAGAAAVGGSRVSERAAILHALEGGPWPDEEARILADTYGVIAANSAQGAPAAATAGRLPLLLFSPGGYQSRHHYTAMAEGFARRGYAVALLSHPFTGLDFFPGLGLIGRHPRWSPAAEEGKGRARLLEEITDCLAADARFALDQLVEDGMAARHPLAGRIDGGRIAILGHSRGGRTVSRAASTDPRIKAAVVYDALPPPRERASGFAQPLLLLCVGDPEGDRHWNEGAARWPPERATAALELVARNRAPAWHLAVDGIGHMNFSDRAVVEPARFPTRIGALRASEIVAEATLAFLDRHLRQDPTADLEAVCGRYPEARLTAGGRSG